MPNQVKYAFDMIPENAKMIDAINKIVFGVDYSGGDANGTDDKPKGKGKEKAKGGDKAKAITPEKLKAAAKATKDEHGGDFAMQVLEDLDIETGDTLSKSLKGIPEGKRAAVVAAWAAGPSDDDGGDDDEGDDWGDDSGDDDDAPEVTADTVKAAVKAYAKEHGKPEAQKLMKKHKVKDLGSLDKAKPETLAKILKEAV